jgi:hypothetical protein
LKTDTGKERQASAGPPAWMEQLPPHMREDMRLWGFRKIADLANAYLDNEKALEEKKQKKGLTNIFRRIYHG